MTATQSHAGTARRDLDALARRRGIQRRYTDGTGQRRHASDDAVMAVLRSMGTPIERTEQARELTEALAATEGHRLCDHVTLLWLGGRCRIPLGPGVRGHSRIELELSCDDGTSISWTPSAGDLEETGKGLVFAPAEQLPAGIHRLLVRAGGREERGTVLAAPPRCRRPAESTGIGVFLPLYALRSDASHGVGTLGDLRNLGHWSKQQGARFVGTLPLLATFLDEPFEPSPYMPVSRSIFGELFVDLHDAARRFELATLKQLLDAPHWSAQASRLRQERLVDYRATWRLVREGLERAAADIRSMPELLKRVEGFIDAEPLIAEYARFRAQGAPAGKPESSEGWLFRVAQWLVSEQLDEASRAEGAKGGLYLDLPIGSHSAGFDAWRFPDLYAKGMSLGAPPDDLFRGGQSWGFPPVIPAASRRLGHEELVAAIDRHLRYAAALRIDHAAGLFRCFWVPDGMSAADGVYVHQPAQEYLAILSILSHRHESTIIAENLGTVPQEISRGLDRRGLLNMSILQFDLGDKDEPLPQPDRGTLAALNTHDMPTFAAHWSGSDIRLHAELGVVDPSDAPRLESERQAMRSRVLSALESNARLEARVDDPQAVLEALLRLAAEAEPSILLINLEDLWNEREPQNIPGVSGGFPNWRRKAARSFEDIVSDDHIGGLLQELSGTHTTREAEENGHMAR